MTRRIALAVALAALVLVTAAQARNPIRRSFFNRYPAAENTQLDELLSNANHCGVCHFDFDGGGPRNPYGVSVEARLAAGMSNDEAVAAVEFEDADNDGFSNYVEITDTANFSNTPTFPGLKDANYLTALNVDHTEIAGYLTPSGATDTDPPVVTVIVPAGGETITAEATTPVQWTAMDAGSGVASINIDYSDDGGAHWKRLAQGLDNTGSFDLFMPHLPGAAILRVIAVDHANPTEWCGADHPARLRTAGHPALRRRRRGGPVRDLHQLPRRLRRVHRALLQLAGQHDGPGHA